MLPSIWKLFSPNRLRSRDIVGNAIIGDIHGLVIQQVGAGPPPEPPTLPWRDLPEPMGTPGEIEIFNLLTWRTRLCDTLFGRDADRDSLLAWAGSTRPFAIRVLSGVGGAGKTRLAAELCETLRQDQWTAGIVRLETPQTLPITSKGLFLAIDYPESNRTAVRAIFRSLATREHIAGKVSAPVRVLLLSRQPISWWFDDLVEAGANELCDSQDCVVGPLDATDTCALVRTASQRLAERYSLGQPRLTDPDIATWHARKPALHGLPLFSLAAVLASRCSARGAGPGANV